MVEKKPTKKEEVKKDVLQETFDRLNKLYGTGTVISGNQKSLDIPSVSTGSLKLDMATGIGGLPYGRIVEIYGPESSGKTTVCIHTVANAQKDLVDTRKCAIVDMEHAIHPGYMKDLGVNLDDLILSQPEYGEAALEVAYQLIACGKVKLVVVDSVAALIPKSELEGEMGESKMAGLGRLMSQSLRKLSPVVERNNVLLIFTNQLRDTPGVMYGSPEKPCGGNSLKFYAGMRIDIRKSVGQAEKDKELNKTTIKVIKSKVSKPFQQCVTEILWGKGFNRIGEIVDMAEEYKILGKKGSWYVYNETNMANGYDAMVEFMKDNEEFALEIETEVMRKLRPEAPVDEKEVLVKMVGS